MIVCSLQLITLILSNQDQCDAMLMRMGEISIYSGGEILIQEVVIIHLYYCGNNKHASA